jgi:hypothetical protein
MLQSAEERSSDEERGDEGSACVFVGDGGGDVSVFERPPGRFVDTTTTRTAALTSGALTFRIKTVKVASFADDAGLWDFVDFKTVIGGTQNTSLDLFHCEPGGPFQERFQPCTAGMTYYYPTSSNGRCPPTTSPPGSICYVKDRQFTNPDEFKQFAHTATVDISAPVPISVNLHETSDESAFPDEHFSFNLTYDPVSKTVTPARARTSTS